MKIKLIWAQIGGLLIEFTTGAIYAHARTMHLYSHSIPPSVHIGTPCAHAPCTVCQVSKDKAQCVGTNAQIYCNVPKDKAELNVSVTTMLSECVKMYLSVLEQMLR